MEIGIVILNYLNWKDTVECVESLLKQTSQSFEMVIVDNHSGNESIIELTKRYQNVKGIHIIETEKNVGFAKGNNTGVAYCKEELGLDNVFVTNNDVVFTDVDYFKKILNIAIPKNVGAVGTRIKGSDGINQNPISLKIDLYTLIKHFVEPALKELGLAKVLDSGHKAAQYFKRKLKGSKSIDHKISHENVNSNNKGQKQYFLHGSAIYFTENYLKNADGFYPNTFLYYEENILAIIFEKMDLKMLYIDDLEMYHKEDQSMALSFKDVSKSKRKFQRKSILSAIRVRASSSEKIMEIFKNTRYSYKEY